MHDPLIKKAKRAIDEMMDMWRYKSVSRDHFKEMEGKLTYLTWQNNLIAMLYRDDGLIHIYSKELDDNFKVGQYSHKYARNLFRRNVMRGMKGYDCIYNTLTATPDAVYCNTTWRSTYGRNVMIIPHSRTIIGTCLNLIKDIIYNPLYFIHTPKNNKMYFMRFRDDKPVQAHAIQSGNGQIYKLKLERVIDLKHFINIYFQYDIRENILNKVLGNGD